MNILPFQAQIASAHVVFNGQHGAVSHLARRRAVSRQTLYREALAVAEALDGASYHARMDELRRQLEQAHSDLHDLQQRQRSLVDLSPDRQACFACTAQAEGVSLAVARRLLQVFLGPQTPSVAQLGRFTCQAGQRAAALLAVLDEQSRLGVRQAAGDEIFVGRQPILMVVEPNSMCWQSGRLAERRDGATWAEELEKLPALEQFTRDGGTGLEKGLQQVNEKRRQAGQGVVADQADHFHILREGTRALRRLKGQTSRALEQAEKAEAALKRISRRGQKRSGAASVAARRWRAAEAAMDRWSAAEGAWQRLREGLRLFSPEGELNTRCQGEALVQEVLPQLSGPEWAKVRRQLERPEVFTFLDEVQEKLAEVPVPAELRAAAVRAEGLRQRPEALRGDSPQAAGLRGLMLVMAVVLAAGKEAGMLAQAGVAAVLRQTWRASSLVEGMNSVLRMQQARHRRLTQGMLDLKRVHWNCRAFRTGRRKEKTPYDLLGLTLPTKDWWELLKLTPEQLREHLSVPEQAA
jgi:hypothetical protein